MLPNKNPTIAERLAKVETWVHKAGEWKYLPVFLFVWTLTDFFTFVLPADAVFIAAVYGCTRRVVTFSLAVILARMIGTFVLYHMTHNIPIDQLLEWATAWNLEDAWKNSRYFFERFGPLSLGFTAMLPFPPIQFVVILSAAAGASLWALELYLVPGLILKCASLYFLVRSGIYVVEKATDPKP